MPFKVFRGWWVGPNSIFREGSGFSSRRRQMDVWSPEIGGPNEKIKKIKQGEGF
jgi:hypothetical protein